MIDTDYARYSEGSRDWETEVDRDAHRYIEENWGRLYDGDIVLWRHGHAFSVRLQQYKKNSDVLLGPAEVPQALKAFFDENVGSGSNLSLAYNRVSDALMARDGLLGALQFYRAIVEALLILDLSNAHLQHDLSVHYERVGNLLAANHFLADALKFYRDGLAISEPLAQADPGNIDWQRDLFVSYEKIGDVLAAHEKFGDESVMDDAFLGHGHGRSDEMRLALPAALTAYRDALAIAERLAQSDPGDLEQQRCLSLLHEKIGDVLMAQGNEPDALPDAVKSYRSALAIRQRLAHLEPGASSQRDLSVSFHKVGDVLMAQAAEDEPDQLDTHSALPAALRHYRSSLAIRERLAQADPGNAAWQRDLSVSYDRIGDVMVAQGDRAGARKLYRDGLAISERLFTAPSDPEAKYQHRLSAVGRIGSRDLIVSYVKIAEVDRPQAKAVLTRAHDLTYSSILATSDKWMWDDLRSRIAGLPQ